MTPIGYLRKVETFTLYIRDTAEADRTQETMDAHCDTIDQAWLELSNDDRLVVYNLTKFIQQNIIKKEPEKPLIQLLH